MQLVADLEDHVIDPDSQPMEFNLRLWLYEREGRSDSASPAFKRKRAHRVMGISKVNQIFDLGYLRLDPDWRVMIEGGEQMIPVSKSAEVLDG